LAKVLPPFENSPTEGLILKVKSPKAPAHLSESTHVWWRLVVRDYQLESHHMRLLQAAAECWDRLQQARELLARDGLVVEGREGGLRPHPAAAIERDSRSPLLGSFVS
jgi:phage terminase small subunit